MKKVFCFNNCACRVFRTNLVLVWFQCCPRYFSRKKGISGTFLSLGLRPRLQKLFPRLPFFYLGNLEKSQIRCGQILPQTWQEQISKQNTIELSFFWPKVISCQNCKSKITLGWTKSNLQSHFIANNSIILVPLPTQEVTKSRKRSGQKSAF